MTKFETQKIEDVSKYLLTDEDAEKVINEKLQKKIVQTQNKVEMG